MPIYKDIPHRTPHADCEVLGCDISQNLRYTRSIEPWTFHEAFRPHRALNFRIFLSKNHFLSISATHYIIKNEACQSFRRFESVYRFRKDAPRESRRGNASTKFRKTLESENSPNLPKQIGAGEISRNLRFSLVFVRASKSDTHHGM